MFKLWIFLWSTIIAFNLIEASGPSSPSPKGNGSSSTPGLTENQRIDQFFREAQFDLKKTIDPKTKKEVFASYINISSLKSKPEDVLKRAQEANLFDSAGRIQEDLYERYKDFKDIEITLDKDNLIIFSPSRSAIKDLLLSFISIDANLIIAPDQALSLDKTSVKTEYQKDFDLGYKVSVDFSELSKDQSAYIKPEIIDSILELDQKEFTRTNLALFNSSFFIYSLFPKDTTLKTFDIHLGITGEIDLDKTFQDLDALVQKILSQDDRSEELKTLTKLLVDFSGNPKSLNKKVKDILKKTFSDKEKSDLMKELKGLSEKGKKIYQKIDEIYIKNKNLFKEIQSKLIIMDKKLSKNPTDEKIQTMISNYDTLKTKINPFISDLNLYLQVRQMFYIYFNASNLDLYKADFSFVQKKIMTLLQKIRLNTTEEEKANLTAQMIPLYEEMQSIFTEKIEPLNINQILKLDDYETRAKQKMPSSQRSLLAASLSGLINTIQFVQTSIKEDIYRLKKFIEGTPFEQIPLTDDFIAALERTIFSSPEPAELSPAEAEAAHARLKKLVADTQAIAQKVAQATTLAEAIAIKVKMHKLITPKEFYAIPTNIRNPYETQLEAIEIQIYSILNTLKARSQNDD